MMVKIGNFLFHYRNGLFPALFVVLLIASTPTYPFGNAQADLWLDMLGFSVALAGQGLRFLTIGYDYIKRGGLNREIYANRLVTGGVFSHSRNPLYLGNILLFIGLVIMMNAWVGYLIGIPLCLFAYAAIIRAEENYLLGKFGEDYRAYCARVNRLWPRWHGFSKSIENMEFSWKRVASKEYNTTFSWLLFAIGLRLWSEYSVTGAIAPFETGALGLIAALVAAAYLAIKIMKKQGKLREA